MQNIPAYRTLLEEKLKPYFSSNLFQQKIPEILLRLTPVLLFVYTSLRADRLSITHDEAGSFTIWTSFNIFKCHFDPSCWGTANLHWLYVLLMKPSVWLFGDSELAIRLPALLGHLIYLVFSFKLVKWAVGSGRGKRPWLALLGFILLNFSPYLLEFFSLARGYGLAMSMMMMSLYFFARWVESMRRSDLLKTFAGAVLAILGNFTMLNFYACLLAVLTAIVLVEFFQKEENRWRLTAEVSTVAVVFSGVLFWLLYRPIGFLRQLGEFEYGAGSFGDTVHSAIKNSLYGERYLKMYNVEFFGGILFGLLALAFFFAVRDFLKNPEELRRRFFLAALLLPVLASLASVVQHYVLGSQYLVSRTALMFIPLTALPVFLLFVRQFDQKYAGWKVVLPALIGLFCVVHLMRAGQLKYTSEWGYDARTEDMLKYLNKKLPPGTKIKLGVHWLYHPSSSYYFKTAPYDFAAGPLTYSKTLRTDDYYDYYYVQPSDMEALEPDYVLERRFSWAGCLMRRKSLPGLQSQ